MNYFTMHNQDYMNKLKEVISTENNRGTIKEKVEFIKRNYPGLSINNYQLIMYMCSLAPLCMHEDYYLNDSRNIDEMLPSEIISEIVEVECADNINQLGLGYGKDFFNVSTHAVIAPGVTDKTFSEDCADQIVAWLRISIYNTRSFDKDNLGYKKLSTGYHTLSIGVDIPAAPFIEVAKEWKENWSCGSYEKCIEIMSSAISKQLKKINRLSAFQFSYGSYGKNDINPLAFAQELQDDIDMAIKFFENLLYIHHSVEGKYYEFLNTWDIYNENRYFFFKNDTDSRFAFDPAYLSETNTSIDFYRHISPTKLAKYYNLIKYIYQFSLDNLDFEEWLDKYNEF